VAWPALLQEQNPNTHTGVGWLLWVRGVCGVWGRGFGGGGRRGGIWTAGWGALAFAGRGQGGQIRDARSLGGTGSEVSIFGGDGVEIEAAERLCVHSKKHSRIAGTT
jgi:hypothetical protein